MNSNEQKTSAEWYEEIPDLRILDHDGWDRKNFNYSWNVERITKEEFVRRRHLSTCALIGRGDS